MTEASCPLELDVQFEAISQPDNFPSDALLTKWASDAVSLGLREMPEHPFHQADQDNPISISLVCTDDATSQRLNNQFRGKDKPTNVLSFPSELPEGLPIFLAGDIIVCLPIVQQEAAAQSKHFTAHFCHMLTHGCLHLLGFDHIDDEEAEAMEALETQLLLRANFPDPYLDRF